MKSKQIFTLVSSLILILSITNPIQAQNINLNTYPEFLEANLPYIDTNYNFNTTVTNMTIQRTFTIPEFRDVTFADVLIQQTGSNVDTVSISLQLNGINDTNAYSEKNLYDREPILFVLDEKAMILPKDPNVLTFTVLVTFKNPNPWDLVKAQFYSLQFNSITIKTTYRQSVSDLTNQINQTNSHFTALIIDPTYNLATQGAIIGNSTNFFSPFTYNMNFYIVLPKELKSNYYLNITFSYDYALDIKSIFIENFGLVTSSPNAHGISYVFRYISNKELSSLSKGTFSFNPRSSGLININLQGNFFITDNYKIFPGGPEMDLFLFVNATIAIPLIVLSKLIYRRFFY